MASRGHNFCSQPFRESEPCGQMDATVATRHKVIIGKVQVLCSDKKENTFSKTTITNRDRLRSMPMQPYIGTKGRPTEITETRT